MKFKIARQRSGASSSWGTLRLAVTGHVLIANVPLGRLSTRAAIGTPVTLLAISNAIRYLCNYSGLPNVCCLSKRFVQLYHSARQTAQQALIGRRASATLFTYPNQRVATRFHRLRPRKCELQRSDQNFTLPLSLEVLLFCTLECRLRLPMD